MKKKLLIFILLLTSFGFSKAQIVSDFEVIKMNLMVGGADDQSSMTVVPNPDPSGINTSKWVVKFVRDKNGVPWGGFWSALPTTVDVTDNKYVHVKVWKPRISPIKFKLEGGAAGNLEIFSMTPQATTGVWEEMVFDFTSKTGTYPIVSFMPDFEDPLTLTDDIVIYFDDIMINNDPTPNSAAVYVIEDYEIMPLNLMIGDPTVDSSSMTLVPNPDPTGINSSNWVVKFVRDKDGVPWGGFWSPTAVDVTTNQYMHVKVWKPRISPIKFKIEGGTAGNLEIFSTSPQISTGMWEDMVFDFTSKTGAYPTVDLMPDFEDPLTLTADMTMYFDDIILNNDPNPIVPPIELIMNVDMHGSGLTAGQLVYLAGDFGGIYGTWSQPGSNTNNEMTDANNDSIYSLTMNLNAGNYNFKFFKDAGWDNGEWTGDPNRKASITSSGTLTYKWGVKPAVATFKVNMKGSGLTTGPVSIVGNFGGIYGTWSEPGTNAADTMTAALPVTDSIYTITMTLDSIGAYQFKFFDGAGWSTGEWTGDPNRKVTILRDTTFAVFKWGQKFPDGISESSLAGKIRTYPNPVKEVLNITTSTELQQVVITNMVGQDVFRLNNVGLGQKTINISQLTNGMYFITFYGKSGGQFTQKILKY
ncbi:MAG: T9SS type A sorting domain-containing protein [Bacteroidetes bacterium]|nr:T9SS type A sorting domain-containing protein [Bacteroidota bacterium]